MSRYLLPACAQPNIVPTIQLTPALVEPASPTPNITLTPTSLPTIEPPPTTNVTPTPEPQRNPVSLEITESFEARYLPRAQFAHRNVSDDAIGKTRNVTGVIQFDGRGAIIPAKSILIVDLSTLRSGDDGRDDYLRGESLKSDRSSLAEFVAIGITDLPRPLPTDGEINVLLLGDMSMDSNTSP